MWVLHLLAIYGSICPTSLSSGQSEKASFEMASDLGEFRFVPPNRAWLKVIGKISEAQVDNVVGRAAIASEGLPYLLIEVDITDMEGATPEARRHAAKLFRQMPPRAFAVTGGAFAQRIIAKLVLKAAEILKSGVQTSEFFPDTEQSNKWLDWQAKQFEKNGRFG